MELIETPLKDCWLIKNRLFQDDRGYFLESYNQARFQEITGWRGSFVQDNQSMSGYGVVRGLHFQKGAHAQAKLVRVLAGTVLDVVVDIRPESPSFGKSFSFELTDDNAFQLFIPRGFAHGFSVLSPRAVFFYKCDNYYEKMAESGIYPFDSQLAIDWKLDPGQAILSQKDQNAGHWSSFLQSIQ